MRFDHVTFTYPGASAPVLRDVSLEIPPGTFVLVSGASGVGKSTLLRCINGLVPHASGGRFGGRVWVGETDTRTAGPGDLARWVGFVFQDPEAQFATDRVEEEVAFALENAGVPPARMRARVEEVMDRLGLTPLRDRPLHTLSGGEMQRVAIAAALVLEPAILVLDEPTSQLDPTGAQEVLDLLARLREDLGITVVVAEHRLERVLPYADRMVYLTDAGRPPLVGPPREVLRDVPLVPPVVALGQALGWEPLPVTVEEARPFAKRLPLTPLHEPRTTNHEPLLVVEDLRFSYDGAEVLRGVHLQVGAGERVVLMGPNGAGKTTLLRCIVGLLKPQAGRIWLAGEEITGADPATICKRAGYLPQDPGALLFAESVREELRVTLANHGLLDRPPIPPEVLLERLGLASMANAYPRDLSVGERARVAIGAVTVTRPQVLLLDEPTRGLDYRAKESLLRLLDQWRADGAGVLIVTHDVELAARAADRVVVLEEGRVVDEGPPRRVLADGRRVPAPQMARLFPSTGRLTLEDVLRPGFGQEFGHT
ncbi:MAG TPA: ATP-binding cassette domain-containing protein [Thermoflexia bacterium]|nr:ATP-binding cassette domain-containing protein [Thermoflexia bacterium]